MQRLRFAAAIAMAATIVSAQDGNAQQTVTDTAQLPAGLATAMSAFNGALSQRDAGAATGFFAEDAVAETPDGVFRGRDALMANWLAPTLGALDRLVLGTNAVFVINGDTVEERAGYTVYPIDAGGQSQSGGYTTVWRRIDAEWRVVRLAVRDG
jgi:ketosteroid isomerase-like protein